MPATPEEMRQRLQQQRARALQRRRQASPALARAPMAATHDLPGPVPSSSSSAPPPDDGEARPLWRRRSSLPQCSSTAAVLK